MTPSFWHGKRVLLTGHTGFKGGWLALWLRQLGAEVTGFALLPDGVENIFTIANVAAGMQSVTGDIRDLQAVKKVFAQVRPEIVLHLAAQSLVRPSYENPVETYATNIMGTVHILEAARLSSTVRAVVNVTSDKCYENREWLWGYRENEPMGGHDPYSSSKGCAELVASAYQRSFADSGERISPLAIASARAGNVIGGGDWARDRIIPDIIRAIQRQETLTLRNPNAIRPWQHVLEPLGGYLLLAEKLWQNGSEFSGGWNFGPSAQDAKPVQSIVSRFAEKWGGFAWQINTDKQPHEARTLFLDSAKALSLLGWQTRWPIEVTLDAVATWYRAYLNKENMQAVTENQIAAYTKALQ